MNIIYSLKNFTEYLDKNYKEYDEKLMVAERIIFLFLDEVDLDTEAHRIRSVATRLISSLSVYYLNIEDEKIATMAESEYETAINDIKLFLDKHD